jgi:hypothetical protein
MKNKFHLIRITFKALAIFELLLFSISDSGIAFLSGRGKARYAHAYDIPIYYDTFILVLSSFLLYRSALRKLFKWIIQKQSYIYRIIRPIRAEVF